MTGSGAFLPGKPIPFDDIDGVLGALDNAPEKVRRWIERTRPVMRELLDIQYVHYAIDPSTREFTEDNVTMAVKAARTALAAAVVQTSDIDLICYGSPHQDQMPTASVRIQEALGIESCDELSIHANCTSAYKALYLAHQLIAAGRNTTALVLSANIASSELRAEYYNQALVDKDSLFLRWFLSDAAGALVLSARRPNRPSLRVEHTYIESVGGAKPSMMHNRRPALWLNPREEYEQGLHHLRQTFRNALSTPIFQEPGGSVFVKGLRRMLTQAGVAPETITLLQVNLPARHIVDSVAEECQAMGIRRDSFYSGMREQGYSGPPAALVCLDKILREVPLHDSDRVASFVTEVSKFMQAGYVMRWVDGCGGGL